MFQFNPKSKKYLSLEPAIQLNPAYVSLHLLAPKTPFGKEAVSLVVP